MLGGTNLPALSTFYRVESILRYSTRRIVLREKITRSNSGRIAKAGGALLTSCCKIMLDGRGGSLLWLCSYCRLHTRIYRR
jgi:hypothetical protein